MDCSQSLCPLPPIKAYLSFRAQLEVSFSLRLFLLSPTGKAFPVYILGGFCTLLLLSSISWNARAPFCPLFQVFNEAVERWRRGGKRQGLRVVCFFTHSPVATCRPPPEGYQDIKEGSGTVRFALLEDPSGCSDESIFQRCLLSPSQVWLLSSRPDVMVA